MEVGEGGQIHHKEGEDNAGALDQHLGMGLHFFGFAPGSMME